MASDGVILSADRSADPDAPAFGKTAFYAKSGRVYQQRPDGVVLMDSVQLHSGGPLAQILLTSAGDQYISDGINPALYLQILLNNLAPSGAALPPSGSVYRIRALLTRNTTAGTTAPVINVRMGTAASTADASIAAFTLVAQATPATADKAWLDIETIWRDTSNTSAVVVETALRLSHSLTTTGIANQAQEQIQQVLNTVDLHTMNSGRSRYGLSINPGTASILTCELYTAQAFLL